MTIERTIATQINDSASDSMPIGVWVVFACLALIVLYVVYKRHTKCSDGKKKTDNYTSTAETDSYDRRVTYVFKSEDRTILGRCTVPRHYDVPYPRCDSGDDYAWILEADEGNYKEYVRYRKEPPEGLRCVFEDGDWAIANMIIGPKDPIPFPPLPDTLDWLPIEKRKRYHRYKTVSKGRVVTSEFYNGQKLVAVLKTRKGEEFDMPEVPCSDNCVAWVKQNIVSEKSIYKLERIVSTRTPKVIHFINGRESLCRAEFTPSWEENAPPVTLYIPDGYKGRWVLMDGSSSEVIFAIIRTEPILLNFHIGNNKVVSKKYDLSWKLKLPPVPSKEGFEGVWDVTGKDIVGHDDLSIYPIYTPKKIYFKAPNQSLGSIDYTPEWEKFAPSVDPYVSAGYRGKWVLTGDSPSFTAVIRTEPIMIDFYVDDEFVYSKEYDPQWRTSLPPVPHIKGFDGAWDIAEVGSVGREDLHINAIYTPECQIIRFIYGNESLGCIDFTPKWEMFAPPVDPYVPDGYKGSWALEESSTPRIKIATPRIEPVTINFYVDGKKIHSRLYSPLWKTDLPPVPAKVGCDGVWGVAEINVVGHQNICVHPVYTVRRYTIIFEFNGTTVAWEKHNHGSLPKIPKVPDLAGYRVQWDEVKPADGDRTYRGRYVPVTIKFIADGLCIGMMPYVENWRSMAPRIPSRDGFTSRWAFEDVRVTGEDFSVYAEYTRKRCRVTFNIDGEYVSETEVDIGQRIPYPDVDVPLGYRLVWDERSRGDSVVVCEGRMEPITIRLMTDRTYRVLRYSEGWWESLPDPPEKPGMVGHWDLPTDKEIGHSDMVVGCFYVPKVFAVTFVTPEGTITTHAPFGSVIEHPPVDVPNGNKIVWSGPTVVTGDHAIVADFKPVLLTFTHGGGFYTEMKFSPEWRSQLPKLPNNGFVWDVSGVPAEFHEDITISSRINDEIYFEPTPLAKTDDGQGPVSPCVEPEDQQTHDETIQKEPETVNEFVVEAELLDIRGIMYLILENWKLRSVQNLLDVYGCLSGEEVDMLKELRKIRESTRDVSDVVDSFTEYCERYASEPARYINALQSVIGDFSQNTPHLDTKGHLTESALTISCENTCICEVCGEEIDYGDKVYVRTAPAPAIRHPKCNGLMRGSHEYAFIDYILREIEYFEDELVSKENISYVLDPRWGLTFKQFKKFGFVTDKKGAIIRLPRFGEFVLDYISGESDYDLMVRYRPYHVYLEYMLRLCGCGDEELEMMGGFKYLLREQCGREAYGSLCSTIESLSYSDLMFDPYIYSIVSSDTIQLIFEAAIKKLFCEMGVYRGEHTIYLNGSEQSYSINDASAESDISIMIDKDGVFCIDYEKSLEFKDYFSVGSAVVKQTLDYISQFGVDL